MTVFFLGRLARSLLTIWLVVTVVFLVLRLSGDPAQALLPDDATPDQVENFRRRFGLDEPMPVQYVRYLAGIAQTDFGISLSERQPVAEIVWQRMPATLELAGAAIVASVLLGVPAGVMAAMRRGSVWDRLLMGGAFVGQSAPNFFVGIILILLFSLQLRLLPSSGRDGPQHLILPAATLATGLLAGLARMTRSALLDTLRQDYVQVARAKGFGEPAILLRHCARNSAAPVVTYFGFSIGVLVGGAAITETVFAWPGVGRLAVGAISVRDYPLIQFIVILITVAVVAVNFVVDVVFGFLDPRVRVPA